MTEDIVNELRDRAYSGKSVDLLLDRAAKTIEDLRQQIKEERAKSVDALGTAAAWMGLTHGR
jgi:hypothetical protein